MTKPVKQKPRYLTKSRFKLALECPAKLYYTGKHDYADSKLEDSFLLALAEGGFQVGELAKCLFPIGHDIKTLDYEESLDITNSLLEQERVTIYEAAVLYENLFIRADVLVKEGNRLKLYEVKAKSADRGSADIFLNKNGSLNSVWKPYVYDVAFQKYVVSNAFPDYEVEAFLMLADKSSRCPTDGLNQKFMIVTDENGRKSVEVSESLTEKDLEPPILCAVNVDDICEKIYAGVEGVGIPGKGFWRMVEELARCYSEDYKIRTPLSKSCGSCEFRTSMEQEAAGLKSGLKECWKEQLGWNEEDFNCSTIFDVWDFRKKDKLIEEDRIKMDELVEDDFSPKEDGRPGISASERRWMQVDKYIRGDDSLWVDTDNLRAEMDSWVFPLHFIDFETTMAAIPFNAGRRPYEGIAFQFSHHIVTEDGTVIHTGEYLNTERGVFPNYDFIRNLKNQLEGDNGSVFRYSHHENTFLNIIYNQLRDDADSVPDADELCEFIKTITRSASKSVEKWCGPRNMIDMCEMVKRYYYNPATGGSNSIKQVLPASLNSSPYLQEKYSKPVYGVPGGIESLNYENWQWIQYDDNGKVKDPYKLLPRMFQDISDHDMEILSSDDELRDGGAALTAYARMQFEQMSDYERSEITRALLKYCELDTMAMVMIYQHWRELT